MNTAGHQIGTAQRRLFVYYSVDAALEDAAIAAASRLQQDLRARHPGLSTTLMRRCAIGDATSTLMEIYAADAMPIDEALQHAIESAAAEALAGLSIGTRHRELFEACA